MEGSEQHSSPKLQIDDEERQQPQQQKQEEQGLGFQSSPPCDPNPDPNRNPPPVDDELKQIVAQLQKLALKEALNEEVQSLDWKQVTDEEGKLKHAIDEELYHLTLKQTIKEALLDKSLNQAIDEEIAANQAHSEGLHDQALRRFMDEVLESHALKTTIAHDKETDHEEEVKAESKKEPEKNIVSEEKEVIDKGWGHEVNENLDWNGRDEVKDDGEIDKDEGKRSENENEDTNDRGEVNEEAGINNSENNWIEYGNEDGNGWDDVKDEDVISKYEDNRSENEEEGYNVNDNDGEDSGSVAASKDGKYRRYQHPLRPDAEDCSFYIRTGTCKFGSNCKFNHPHRRRNQTAKETVNQKDESSERPAQTECKYYLTSGGCKYGKACRYNHSRGRTAVAPILEFNFLGLPIRHGERECPYYMRNGSCKYGSNCRFNHPDPTAVGGGDPPSRYGNGGSVSLQGASQTTMSSWSSPGMLNETSPFVPMMYPPTQGVPSPNPEWNGYQAPVYPTSEMGLPTPPAFSMNSPATDTNFYTHHPQQMQVEEFPERPGQPECSYFLKTGDCKYRSGCKFHHPRSRIPKTPPYVLSDKGLPLRPDQNICTHYSRYGICKFGPACKYDHPVNYVSGPDQPPPPFGNSATAEWG